jgi:glycosyltransferase involved in cell wall biosynthesis
LLRECLESVSAQTLANWECIVVDDASSDDSLAVAIEYQSRDARFRALSRQGSVKGAAARRNQGLQASAGRYVVFLDSDDLLHPECLAKRIAFLAARRDALDFAVFPTLTFRDRPGDCDILWNIEKPIPDLLRYLRLDIPWSTTASIWRSEAVKSFGGFEESLPGWQDWQVHVVALLESLRYARGPSEPDSYWRGHGDQQISDAAGLATHVEPKTKYLLVLMKKYHDKLHTDEALRSATAGLMWYQVVQLERAGMLGEALRFWWRTRRLNYINGRILREGAIALVAHGKPGGSLAWEAVRRWPNDIVNSIDRTTCHAVSHDLQRGCAAAVKASSLPQQTRASNVR